MADEIPRDNLPALVRHEDPAGGLQRVVAECCAEAVQSRARVPDDETVHRARKALKRARAILRLGQILGVKGASTVQRRLARCARRLSARRDATVTKLLAQRLAPKLDGDARAGAEYFATGGPRPASQASWTTWIREVVTAEQLVARLVWVKPSRADLIATVAKASRRLKKRAHNYSSDDIETVHEWRKAAVVLREQLAVLGPVLGLEAAPLWKGLCTLARRLGKAVDYQVLLHALRRRRCPSKLRAGRAKLEIEICRRRDRAIGKARKCWPKVKRELKRTV